MALTNEQKEIFIEEFTTNELEILETYTMEDLRETIGKDIPDMIENDVINWKDIEEYLRDRASKYNTIEQIRKDFDDVYDHVLL